VLTELGADEKRILVVFNKIDKVTDPAILAGLRVHFPGAHFISVQTGEGIEELVARLADLVGDDVSTIELRIPQDRAELVARLHRDAVVLHTDYVDNDVRLVARVSGSIAREYEPYQIKPAAPVAGAAVR
jgi:GTP-binding protein HflX